MHPSLRCTGLHDEREGFFFLLNKGDCIIKFHITTWMSTTWLLSRQVIPQHIRNGSDWNWFAYNQMIINKGVFLIFNCYITFMADKMSCFRKHCNPFTTGILIFKPCDRFFNGGHTTRHLEFSTIHGKQKATGKTTDDRAHLTHPKSHFIKHWDLWSKSRVYPPT